MLAASAPAGNGGIDSSFSALKKSQITTVETSSPSTVFLGHPRETMATFLRGFGVPPMARDAVAGPTSEAVDVVDVERAAATPRVVGFRGNAKALAATGPPRCAATPVAWGSCMSSRIRLGQWAWRWSFCWCFSPRVGEEEEEEEERQRVAKPIHIFSSKSTPCCAAVSSACSSSVRARRERCWSSNLLAL